jgi:polyhydroxybutyrate depolymerase
VATLRSVARRAALVLVTALIAGCAAAVPDTAAAPPAPDTAARPAGPGDALTGCGRASPVPPGQSVVQEVTSGGLRRTYLLHLPNDYQPSRPTPLVLSFHGHRRTSEYQQELSGFSATEAIAVYPQGLIGTDGLSAWTGAPYSASADDVLFTGDLLNQLEARLCVDRARIYAAGKSNGGGFVGLLACRMADRIAAFAPVSGAFYPEGGACNPTRPVPIIDFHGGADTTIPYAGDPAKGLPAIPDWLAGWAGRNGCAGAPAVRNEFGGQVQVSRWRPCRGDAEIVHYKIDGLGHDWPSTQPNLDSATPTVLDATPLIMAFFDQHKLKLG